MNVLDGAFFTLGLAFWSSATILPLYASHLTDAVLAETVNDLRESSWTRNGSGVGSQDASRGRRNVEGLVAGPAVGRSAVHC